MYVNTIIALEENMPTYGIDGKKVTGHVTITSPGIIKCYVQNLNTKKQVDLAFYAFSNKEQKAVRLGLLNKGSESRETRWNVDEKNIKGSKLALSAIDSVAIIKEGDGMRSTDTILVGYSGERYIITSLLERVLPISKVTVSPKLETGLEVIQAPPQEMVIKAKEELESIKEEVVEKEKDKLSQPINQEIPMIECEEEIEQVAQNDQEEEVAQANVRESIINIMKAVDKIGTKGLAEIFGKQTIGVVDQKNIEEVINLLANKEAKQSKVTREAHPLLETVLKEKYMKQQTQGAEEVFYNEELIYNEMGSEEEAKNEREEDLGGTLEEINYLEEIEKKLKDIQARLRVSDILEENIRKMRPTEKIENVEEGIPETVAIEDIARKIVEYKSKLENYEAMTIQQDEINRVERIFNKNIPCEPIEGDEGIEWRKISLSELVSIPSLTAQWCTQPFITFSYYKHNDFILGRESESGSYYLGIPDLYHPDRESLRNSEPNIERFLCKKDTVPVTGEYGYWLVRL
ncbi:hypothetical protein CS063_08780 [Sporanaerobium hydrogeniformans]|uniref:Uncharacterized protein n=1 Tax=Sporanaerobium hydrogeniformans TaxID=3072179 RepID=A0AC61DCS5_9FIRM|nr:hypothetical protein [Sporanaerobium hydrogeniformans]PHV70848.1 hypothetical protein CS063_08780 [Sporanaerobium hydrogeniformans]